MIDKTQQNNFIYVSVIQVVATALGVFLGTFSTTLFLSNFPSSWIPYYFIISPLFTGFIIFTVIPYLQTASIKPSLIAHYIGIFLIISFIILNYWPNKIMAFVYTFIVLLVAVLYSAVAWNVAAIAFEHGIFKQFANKFLLYNALGSIAAGFLAYISIDLFGHESMILIALISMIISTYTLTKTQAVKLIEKTKITNVALSKYKLYIALALFMLLLNFISTLANYEMMYRLKEAFPTKEIAKYMTIFYFSQYSLTFLLQTSSDKLLARFGVGSLFATLGIFVFSMLFPLYFYPNLYVVTFFLVGIQAIYYSFVSSGRQISLNVLPMSVRNKGQLYIKIGANNIGIITAGLLSIWLGYHYEFYPYQILTTISVAIIFYLSWLLKKYYGQTLQDLIKEKRFYLPLSTHEFDNTLLKQQMKKLLTSNDSKQIFIGFSILKLLKPEKAPRELFKLFNSEDFAVRVKVYKTLKYYPKICSQELLMRQLVKETELHARWHLLSLILDKYPEVILLKANKYLNSEDPAFKSIAILALGRYGDLEDVRQATVVIESMVDSDFEDMRLFAARLLGMVNLGTPTNTLRKLIEDKNTFIKIHAIRSSKNLHDKQIVKMLINQLGQPGVTYEIIKALQNAKADVIYMLYKECLQTNVHRYKPLLRALCHIQQPNVETALCRIMGRLSLLFSVEFAKQVAIRATQRPLTSHLKQKIRQQLENTFIELQQYTDLFNSEADDFKRHELLLRKQLVEKKMICFLAAVTTPRVIMELLPKLAQQHKSQSSTFQHELALDYLDWLITDRKLARKIFASIEARDLFPTTTNKVDVLVHDQWIKQVMNYQKKEEIIMDTMEKMIELRKVDCFKNLPAELLLSVAEECVYKEFMPDEIIFTEGSSPEGLFILLEGEIHLINKDKLFRIVKESELFGLFSTISTVPNPLTAVTKSTSVTLMLQRYVLEQLMDDYPDFLKELMAYTLSLYANFLDFAKREQI